MKYRYKDKPAVVIPGISTRTHAFQGFTWNVLSSKGDSTYAVRMEPTGFTCDCIGFSMHGKCKHIQEVGEHLLTEDYPRYR